jgi:hypothetical protein
MASNNGSPGFEFGRLGIELLVVGSKSVRSWRRWTRSQSTGRDSASSLTKGDVVLWVHVTLIPIR